MQLQTGHPLSTRFASVVRYAGTVLAAMAILLAGLKGNATAPPRDRSIADACQLLRLRDPHGNEHTLAEFDQTPHLVIAILGTECPLARLYAGKLARLEAQYRGKGVAFLGVMPNFQDSLAEISHFVRTTGLEFPVWKDPTAELADTLGALRTPEVFLLDRQRRVRYHGRIDDQYGVGYQRPRPTRDDLANAIERQFAGDEIAETSTPAVGCLIGRWAPHDPAPTAPVTWSGRIASLFQTHCQDCHRPGQIGPFPLLTYEDTQGWGPMIREVVTDRRMPPWHAAPSHHRFVNDARLTEDEVGLVQAWADAGCPVGDLQDAPPPRTFTEGWQIPEPDQIVHIQEHPVTIAPEGVIEYQWFEVDPGFREDRWIAAVECRPGNPRVVHHMTVYFRPSWADRTMRLNDRINMLAGYAPGKRPLLVEEWDRTALYVPAGSKLRFEMHYTPNGTEQTDRSAVAFRFADPQQVEKQVSVVAIGNTDFVIPPESNNHRVDADYTLDEDSLLYALSPHMHLRGKSFRFWAITPNGGQELLLDVPRFDFNWQTAYRFTQPLTLAQGTRIACVAHFDNSVDNLSNPDPTATVRWGDQTWEEMMLGVIAIAPADQDLRRGQGRGPRLPRRFDTRAPLFMLLAAMLAAVLVVLGVRRWRRARYR